jgi:hypothetical protein
MESAVEYARADTGDWRLRHIMPSIWHNTVSIWRNSNQNPHQAIYMY